MDASEINLEESLRKKFLNATKERDEILFPKADGTANLSGRDQEFGESTQRQH